MHARLLLLLCLLVLLLGLPPLLLPLLHGFHVRLLLLLPMQQVHVATSVHDSAFNSGSAGGLLPVCKSTSYNLEVCSQGPTGRRCTKGGVSGPAEDLHPVPEVEAGVNFRPAGRVRGQVAGSLPGRQPGTGTRTGKGSVVTPSLHPEVPDSLSVSPGPGKRIRQLMGWTKVCGTTQSGIWVLKGNARTWYVPCQS